MSVNTSRDVLSRALRSYGEDLVAKHALAASDDTLRQIGERAGWYLDNAPGPPSGASILIDTALALATVEIIEGSPRALLRKRRKLKGIYQQLP